MSFWLSTICFDRLDGITTETEPEIQLKHRNKAFIFILQRDLKFTAMLASLRG